MNEVAVMNNDKVYVKIGRQYRDAFRSICALVSSGCIDRSIIQACRDNRVIETEQYIFEYVGDVQTIDSGAVEGMLPGGASWFRGFRGVENDSVMGIWHNLLELVSTNYHKQFSLVEFMQNEMSRDEEQLKEQQKVIQRVADGLKLRVTKVVPAGQKDSVEDVYAVSLRMEIFSGIGEPRPLLCKIYFRKTGKDFRTVLTAEAAEIDNYVSSIVSQRGAADKGADADTETEIVDNVLNSLDKLLKGEMDRSFSDGVLVTNATDLATLEDLTSGEPQDEVQLACKKIKVLGISHIQWVDPVFEVYVDGQKAFFAKITQDGVITMTCRCGGARDRLIERNIITCISPETGAVKQIRINTAKPDLGLTAEQVETIQRESPFAEHFFPISCSELTRRNIDCVRYRCLCNTVAFEDHGRTRYKCADCPYPEVLYHCEDGEVAYTPLLNFDTETLRVVAEETTSCRLCGRSYTADGLNSQFYCKFCAAAMDAVQMGETNATHTQNYRRYAQMLPLSLRVLSVFQKKYCFENQDRLIFFVGNKKYFFDKLTLNDSGMIPKPEKRH